jgi:hypothetical protein
MIAVAGIMAGHHSGRAMSRWSVALLFSVAAIGTTASADQAPARRQVYRARINLPAGLPRPHYDFRTTISYRAPYAVFRPYAHTVYAYEPPEVLFTPVYYEPVAYVGPWIGVGLLPGSWTFPGYYGSPFSYDYQSSYYGGPYYYAAAYTPYWDRLPYACGVYGYC